MRVLLTVYFLVFCGFCYGVNTDEPPLCSDFIEFTGFSDGREGTFDIALPEPVHEGSIEVTISISNACQTNSCSFTLESHPKMAKDRYKKGLPVRYSVTFRGQLKDTWIGGITVRSANHCRVICRHGNDNRGQADHVMRHKLSLGGEMNSLMSRCDPIQHIEEPEVPCGVVPESANFIHSTLNGTAIRRGSWPWLAAIYISTRAGPVFQCQGTVITNRIVLTTVSCFWTSHPLYLRASQPFEQSVVLSPEGCTVILGRHNLNDLNEEGYDRYNLLDIRTHPDHKTYVIPDGDIALLITDRKIMFSETVRPACISSMADKQYGTVVGWRFGENWSRSSLPIKDEVPIVPHDECWPSGVGARHIPNRTFCGGRPFNGPGLGLYTENSNIWSIRGISMICVPGGFSICDPDSSVIYVDISKYFTWIVIEGSDIPY